MRSDTFIAGDWGTTRLRLFLCAGDTIVASRTGAGIGALERTPQAEFAAIADDWLASHRIERAVLCGMVGSRNGWHETPYRPCPASFADLRLAFGHVRYRDVAIRIVPGLSCTSPVGAPDVMRGEETQIFGALQLQPQLAHGSHVLALPGTHTKWVVVESGRVMQFQTAIAGELFALLRTHSTLLKAGASTANVSAASAFEQGLSQADDDQLLHRLFQVRSRQLLDGQPADEAAALLSGLLIGTDVAHAQQLLKPDSVTLIGDSGLASLYARALQRHGIGTARLDGNDCALAALRRLASE